VNNNRFFLFNFVIKLIKTHIKMIGTYYVMFLALSMIIDEFNLILIVKTQCWFYVVHRSERERERERKQMVRCYILCKNNKQVC